MASRVTRLALALSALALAAAVAACGGATDATMQPAASAAPGGASPGAAAPSALPAEVDTATARQLQESGAFVLDVRQPDEWAAGHIEGATLIPLGDLPARLGEVPADQQVVVVCRSGNRSAAGRDILLSAGRTGVTSMAGGMNDWTAAGYPVVTGP
jgi:rhodanese-related sulfurtransferase